jgi:DNA polymerase elongation subunit (family B)
MKIFQINRKSKNDIQDMVDMSKIGDFVIITNITEIADRKLFADKVKEEVNKMYGEIASKVTNMGKHLTDLASHYPHKIQSLYGDTDSIFIKKPSKNYICQNKECNNTVEATQSHCCPICKMRDTDNITKIPIKKPSHKWKQYYLISYAWHLVPYNSDWKFENTVTDKNPTDWLKSMNTGSTVTKLLNATIITEVEYKYFKELFD